MRLYDDFSIIAVLIKRKKVFATTLVLCLILGSFWTYRQITAIQQEQISYHTPTDTETIKISFVQYNHYGKIALSQSLIRDTLLDFYQRDIINDFREYITTPYFTIYALFYTGDDPTQSIATALESNPITQKFKRMFKSIQQGFTKDEVAYANIILQDGFFLALDDKLPYIQDPTKSPINKHYIHLDKNRLSQKGYSVTSTEIIKNHQSLNSNKIWVFMIICSIMISVFLVFVVENSTNIRKRLRSQR